jgi:hypothetical protein
MSDPNIPHFSTATPDHPEYRRHVKVKELMDLIESGEIDEYEADRRLDTFDRDNPTPLVQEFGWLDVPPAE